MPDTPGRHDIFTRCVVARRIATTSRPACTVICNPDRFAVDLDEEMPYRAPRFLFRPAFAAAARYPIDLRAGAPARRQIRTDR
ncbi:hypothetical protein [Burkholderia sp. PR2]|uniref:hypothetical protein n=1 Tax=Burkholderia sp. PR2 TaxID=3448078 RepID=UPI00402AC243